MKPVSRRVWLTWFKTRSKVYTTIKFKAQTQIKHRALSQALFQVQLQISSLGLNEVNNTHRPS